MTPKYRTVTVEVDLLLDDETQPAAASLALARLLLDFSGALRKAGIVNVGGGRVVRDTGRIGS